eukprot:1423045-Pyramimonas_sp.AAC.1
MCAALRREPYFETLRSPSAKLLPVFGLQARRSYAQAKRSTRLPAGLGVRQWGVTHEEKEWRGGRAPRAPPEGRRDWRAQRERPSRPPRRRSLGPPVRTPRRRQRTRARRAAVV